MRFERRLYGHRGASAVAPENTVEAFDAAVDAGVQALESDVHQTVDGHLVLAHDPDGERMAGVRKKISACTLDELRRWDVGRGFRDRHGEASYEDEGCRVQTFADMLERYPQMRFNVDIKVHNDEVATAVVELLRNRGDQARVTLASFSTQVLDHVIELGYEGEVALGRNHLVKLAFLPSLFLANYRRTPPRAVQVPTRAGAVRFDKRAFIQKCHDLGMRVDFWTVNRAEEAERLLDLGADGIMSDDPALIASAF